MFRRHKDILDRTFRWAGIRDPRSHRDPVLNTDANTITADTCINGSVVATIAYTVAEYRQPARDLQRFIQSGAYSCYEDIGYTTPPYQLEELITKPLRTLGNSMSARVVVLDALNECKEAATISVILSSLSRYVNQLSPLKFSVTSRPGIHITVFKSSKLNPVTRRYVLHEVESGVVQKDIEHYISTKLAFIRELYLLDPIVPTRFDDVEDNGHAATWRAINNEGWLGALMMPK